MGRITILTNCTHLGKLITNQSKQTQKAFLLDCWPSPSSQGIRIQPGVRPRVQPCDTRGPRHTAAPETSTRLSSDALSPAVSPASAEL